MNRLKQAGFYLKKHLSRDKDEYFIKISAPQELLEDVAEGLDNFKVKITDQKMQAVLAQVHSQDGDDTNLTVEERLQLEGG